MGAGDEGDRLMKLRKVFAGRLNDAMVERGVSQKRLAQLLDTYPSKVSNWQNAKQLPLSSQALDIAMALDVTLDYLFGRVEGLGEYWKKTATEPVVELEGELGDDEDPDARRRRRAS